MTLKDVWRDSINDGRIVFLIGFIGVYAIFAGLQRTAIAIIFWSMMLFIVLWFDRGTEEEKRIGRIIGAVTVVVLILVLLFETSILPVSALTISTEQQGEQLRIDISGIPPYEIWRNGDKIAENYPAGYLYTTIEPGQGYIISVTDLENETASESGIMDFYNYPLSIWLLIILSIVMIIIAIKIMFMAFPALALTALLMLYITPDVTYIPILRIIPALLLIGAFGTFWLHGDES